jgi:hypothetical protein
MSRYQLLPDLSPEQYAALYADIQAAGVRVPIDVDENGEILDGHHRKKIADELGKECPERVVRGLAEFEKVDYSLTVNLARRHLNGQEKSDLVKASLKRDPRLSNREHARRCGVGHPFVASMRAMLEDAGQLQPVASRVTRSGGEYPSDRSPRLESDSNAAPTAKPPLVEALTDAIVGATERAQPSAPSAVATGPEPTSPVEVPVPAPDLIQTPVGPITPAVAAALDKHVPNPDPHAEWRSGYLKRIRAVYTLILPKPEDVAEKADETCLDELRRVTEALVEHRQAIVRAVMASTPDNVTPIRRTS